MSNTYQYRSIVTLGDIDMLQGMYYLNQLKLEAITRERWMMECVPNYMGDIEEGLALVTRDTACKFFKIFKVNDHIDVKLQFIRIQKSSFVMRFMHVNEASGEVHAEGEQTIVFINRHSGKIARIPDNWRSAISNYLV